MEDIKQKRIELLEMKYTIPERKVLLEGIIRCYSRKAQGMEESTESIQNKTQRDKK